VPHGWSRGHGGARPPRCPRQRHLQGIIEESELVCSLWNGTIGGGGGDYGGGVGGNGGSRSVVCCPVATTVQGADPSPASVLNRAAFDDGIGVLDQLKMATKIIAIVHMLQLIVLIFKNRFLSCCNY
jgi:hypothetical protein